MMATGRDQVVSPARTSWRVNVGTRISLLGGKGVFFGLSFCHTPKGGPFSSPFSRESGNLINMKVRKQTGRGGHVP